MELLVLDKLNWISCSTPSISSILSKKGSFNRHIAWRRAHCQTSEIHQKFRTFCWPCIAEYTFQRYPPSIMASRIVYASRRAPVSSQDGDQGNGTDRESFREWCNNVRSTSTNTIWPISRQVQIRGSCHPICHGNDYVVSACTSTAFLSTTVEYR